MMANVEVDKSFNLVATTTSTLIHSSYRSGTGTVTIIDDDVLPTLTISDVTTPVAESDGSVNFVGGSTRGNQFDSSISGK